MFCFFTVIGIVFLVVSVLYFLFKLRISFDTEGGVVGMVPVLDGAVFPSIFGWFGVSEIERGTGWPGWPIWAYILAALLSSIVLGFGIWLAGKWGEKCHRP
jgi:hypothetical protein